MDSVDSESDDRTVNNAVRHQYHVLSDVEKAQMVAIKDKGAEFLELIETLRAPTTEFVADGGAIEYISIVSERELDLAVVRVEEAVMWAVKHITA